jgi:hypothetical protein
MARMEDSDRKTLGESNREQEARNLTELKCMNNCGYSTSNMEALFLHEIQCSGKFDRGIVRDTIKKFKK